jgi:hypothetical protein
MTDNPFAAPASFDQERAPKADNQYSYRSTKGFVTAAVIGMALYCLMTTATLLMSTAGTLMYPNFNDINAELTDQTEQLLAIGVFGSVVIGGLSLLLTAIATCMFMNRSNKNARALGATGLEFTPAWSVGVWFIPIINLFRPYYAMKEIQMASTIPDERQWKNVDPSELLTPWWACWIIGGMIGRFIDRAELRGADFGVGGLVFQWLAGMLLIAGGVLLIQILRNILNLQTAAAGMNASEQFGRE